MEVRIRARHMHAIEGFVDNSIGLILNYLAIILIYNALFGHDIKFSENVVGGVIMFFIAWARKYTIRRWFSAWIGRIYERRKKAEDNEIQKQTGES